jgi:hypothetical protein
VEDSCVRFAQSDVPQAAFRDQRLLAGSESSQQCLEADIPAKRTSMARTRLAGPLMDADQVQGQQECAWRNV